MFKHFLLATTLFGVFTPTASAMTDAECIALSLRPEVYASGKLTPIYSEAFTKSGRTIPSDGIVDQIKFIEACKADAFKSVALAPEPGAPFAGSNSFTEAQAMDRIGKSGFTDVTGLKKDDQGIWRGTAMQAGKSTPVALDFKGNVVAK